MSRRQWPLHCQLLSETAGTLESLLKILPIEPIKISDPAFHAFFTASLPESLIQDFNMKRNPFSSFIYFSLYGPADDCEPAWDSARARSRVAYHHGCAPLGGTLRRKQVCIG